MTRFLALFLAALVLLQSFGRELLVVGYELNKAEITARYCVNKARPQLRCNGRCHLAKQLRQAEGSDRKAPADSAAKVKFEVLPVAGRPAFGGSQYWFVAARRPIAPASARYTDATSTGVFRPPLSQV